MKNDKIRSRSYVLVALVIMLPIIFSFYSPVIMAWGILNRIITVSALLFVTWFILSLFMGRSVSCGYTCPYGALQEILGGKILKKRPKFKKADKIRYLVCALFLLMASYFILKGGGLIGVDLFASNATYSILGITGSKLAILIPVSILVIALLSILFGSRAFCRYLCPQGVFLTVGSIIGRNIKIPSLQLISNQDSCSKCKLCDKSCPMGLNVSYMVDNGSMDDLNCILCGECIDKCPKEAINYSLSTKD